MNVSSELLEILKNREKLRLVAYLGQEGKYTIGWGATTYESGAKVKQGDTITEARAVQLLNFHVGVAASAVNGVVTAILTQGQFDALVSFTYNSGGAAFAGSTLKTLVNTNPNDFDRIEAEFLKWVYVTKNGVKVKSDGLVNRRLEEIEIYRSGAGIKKKVWLALAVIAAIILYYYAQRIRNN